MVQTFIHNTGVSGSDSYDGANNGPMFLRQTIDCYHSVADGGLGTIPLSSTMDIMKLKAGWLVKNVWIRIVRAASGGADASSVGTSGDATKFIATLIELDATAGTVKGSLVGDTIAAGRPGFIVKTDDYIMMTLNADANYDGIFEVIAEVVDLWGFTKVGSDSANTNDFAVTLL